MKKRPKMSVKSKICGSISILLIVIMVPMMTLSAFVVDTSRLNLAKSSVSSAGDLAINSALANYDTVLKDVYGLFAMSQDETTEDLQKRLKDYFAKTLVSYGVVNDTDADNYIQNLLGSVESFIKGNSDTASNFMDMDISNFNVVKSDTSSLAKSNIMRSQIVEYMKYRAPLNTGLSFLDSLKIFQNAEPQAEVVKSQVVAEESSQDVTSSCKEAIRLYREFDANIDKMNTADGENAVKGKANPSDNVLVPFVVADNNDNNSFPTDGYFKHVLKYKDQWGNNANYKKINQMLLVFFPNDSAKGVDDTYLKKCLSNTEVDFMIKSSGSIYEVKNTDGINIDVPTKTAYQDTWNDFDAQIRALGSGTHYTVARKYEDQKYLPRDNSHLTGTSDQKIEHTNVDNVMNAFVDYKKFLLNDNSAAVKYSDYKAMLEELYKLKKFKDAYNAAADRRKGELEAERDAFNRAADEAKSKMDGYISILNRTIPVLNEMNSNFSGIDKTVAGDQEDVVSALLNQHYSLQADVVQHYGVTTYLPQLLFTELNVVDEESNKYNILIETIRVMHLNDDCSYVIRKFDEYTANNVSQAFNQWYSEESQYSSSNNNRSNAQINTANRRHSLVELLTYLEWQSNKLVIPMVKEYNQLKQSNGGKNYGDYLSVFLEKKQAASNKQTEINTLESNRNAINQRYSSLITGSPYQTSTTRYQQDKGYYQKYIDAATSYIEERIKEIREQYDAMEANIEKVINDIADIVTQLGNVRDAIKTYNQNLDNWKTTTQNYEASSGSDSFSEQNLSDCDASKKEYDPKNVETLITAMNSYKAEYESLLSVFKEDAPNYKYGTKKINKINSISDLKNAAKSVRDTLTEPVTPQIADTKFESLYPNNEQAPNFEIYRNGKYLETDHVLPIRFLYFLNETFPPPEQETDAKATVKVDGQDVTVDYDSTKTELNNNSGGETADDTKSDDTSGGDNNFGYSYGSDGKKANSDDLPSKMQSSDAKEISTQKMKISEDGDKVNASSGLSTQTTNLSTVLNGIGNVATAALENMYILSYLFENFSYNTLIQDAVIKGENVESVDDLFDALAEVKTKHFKDDVLKKYRDKQMTLSHCPMKAANNHFYGAEIEYMLYGNENPSTNVTYAKASIYAIRFIFNTIFAFTDSEIRNTTMSIGLAVQAATCGFVPYKVVQIVMQLALAALESAIDLDAIGNGIKVAVVKTNDTWSLKLSNALKNVAKAAIDATVEAAANGAERLVKEAVKNVSAGLQNFVDSKAEEAKDSFTNMSESLKDGVRAKSKEILNTGFSVIQSSVEEAIKDFALGNELQDTYNSNMETFRTNAKNKINGNLSGIKSTIENKIDAAFPENDEITNAAKSAVKGKIDTIIDAVKTEINNDIDAAFNNINGQVNQHISAVQDKVTASVESVAGKLLSRLSHYKETILNKINSVVDSATNLARQKVDAAIEDIDANLNQWIQGKEEQISNMTEEKIQQFKDNASEKANAMIDKYLDKGASVPGSKLDLKKPGTSTGKASKSFASMFKFGYKEYLMLFTYLGICVNGNDILTRTADVIQMNIQNAKKDNGATYEHKLIKDGKSFKMSDANTYIMVNADVKLNMLFLNMDFFSSNLGADSATVDDQLKSFATIKYNNIYGY